MSGEGLPLLLTVEEAGALLRIGRTKAYTMAREWRETDCRSGLPVIDLGHVLRVPRRALEEQSRHSSGSATSPLRTPTISHRLPSSPRRSPRISRRPWPSSQRSRHHSVVRPTDTGLARVVGWISESNHVKLAHVTSTYLINRLYLTNR